MKDKLLNIIGYLIERKMEEEIKELVKEFFPSGSGFNSGTKLLSCTAKQIVLQMDFHHMNEGGFYDGWTEHKVYIRPSFYYGFQIMVSGPDRSMIKEYILDTICELLQRDVEFNVKIRAKVKLTSGWV